MKYFSLSFLYAALLILTCSRINIFRSDRLWPGELKWAPVDMLVISFTTLPRCSASRYFRGLPVSPIYRFSSQCVWKKHSHCASDINTITLHLIATLLPCVWKKQYHCASNKNTLILGLIETPSPCIRYKHSHHASNINTRTVDLIEKFSPCFRKKHTHRASDRNTLTVQLI